MEKFKMISIMSDQYCQEAVSLNQLLQEMELPARSRKPLVVANLGCSSRTSTIETVNHVVRVLRSRYRTENMPEIMVCFNDKHSYDFNALLKVLNSMPKSFFLCGVPGSVYNRLLPRSHVNVFVSTDTLHWLSEVPSTVMDVKSPAYNGKRWGLEGSSKAVVEEYMEQAKRDMRSFLDARAVELVSGGLLYCSYESAEEFSKSEQAEWLRPLSEDSETTSWTICRAMEHVWDELIAEGLLSENQRALSNLALYKRTEAEVKQVLDEYSHLFHVQKFEVVKIDPPDFGQRMAAEDITNICNVRSKFGPALVTYLGTELAEMMFSRFRTKFSDKSQVRKLWLPSAAHVLILIRR